MIKKLNTVIIILAVFLSFVISTMAAPRISRDMKFRIGLAERCLHSARILLRLKEKIGLNETQVKQIEKYDLAFKQSQIKSQAEIKLLTLQLQSAFKDENIQRKKVESLIRSIAKLKTTREIDRFHYLLDLKEVLKKDQLKNLEEMKKKMMRNRWKRRPANFRNNRRFQQPVNRK